jgi:uncharacterized membrane protein YphA (DoxX/SURF4 family)
MTAPNMIKQDKDACCREPGYQAFLILRFAFTIAPILAGLDKFFNLLTNWGQYLSAPFDLFGNPHTTMMVVGVIEIVAGILVWIMPRIFSYVVAIWLLAIIINLLILHRFYDIALRDLGLLLAALALGRLSQQYSCETCNLPRKDDRRNP